MAAVITAAVTLAQLPGASVAAASPGTPSGPAGHASSAATSFADGQVIVALRPGTPSTQGDAVARRAGGHVLGHLTRDVVLVSVAKGTVGASVRTMAHEPAVEYAEPDYLMQESATPNDPSFTTQWAHQNTGQAVNGTSGTPGADERTAAAWSVATGSPSVVIAETDTGVDYNHPDLAPNIWSNPGGVGGCSAGTHGYNAVSGTCDPMDDDTSYNGHGTHVAGILGAAGNNGIGVSGVNWSTSILPVKWLDSSGSGTTSNLIRALDWVASAQQAGVNVRVVNNSATYIGTAYSQALSDEIDQLGSQGILFVAAAGNTGNDNDDPAVRRYPCGYDRPTEICVTASDQNDRLPSWANRGATTVDMAAPGNNIYSTLRSGSYGFISGGSMAAPQVSGAAALVLSQVALSPTALKARLLESADKVSGVAGLVRTGRLNVCNAVPGCGTAPPTAAAPFAITPPAVTGLVAQGQVLHATAGVWDRAPTSHAYQWSRCSSTGISCNPIAGASGSSYQLTSSDVGSTLRAVVSATNGYGTTPSTSPPSAVITAANTFGYTGVGPSSDPATANWKRVDVYEVPAAVSVTKLTIYAARLKSGSQVIKGVIYADQHGSPGPLVAVSNQVTFSGKWSSGWYDLPFSSAVPIGPGSYWIGLIAGDTGNVVGLRYRSAPDSSAVSPNTYSSGPTNPFGTARFDSEQLSLYATYTPTVSVPSRPPVNTAAPTISGTTQQGQTLTASTGTWTNSPTSYAYQWLRCSSGNCAAVAGASSSTYLLSSADVGATLEVVVTASNADGSASATSAPTATVQASTTSGTFGLTAVGSNTDTLLVDRKRVNHYTLGVAANVSKISVYLAPTSTTGQETLKGVLYANTNGVPGALLATTTELTFHSTDSAGWYDLTFASPVPLAAGTYWIGMITGGTSYVIGIRWNSVSGSRAYNGNSYASGPTDPFGSATIDAEEMSLYATYST